MLSKNLKEKIIIKKVETIDELVEVGRIVYNRYLNAGYIEQNKFNLWITHFQLLPEADVFILKNGGNKILTTISILDGDNQKLPCEYIFGDYVNNLKKSNKVAEIMCLANIGVFDMFLLLTYNVFKWCVDKFDLLLIETHPKRKCLFNRFAFSVCGNAERHFAADAPVIFMSAKPQEVVAAMELKYNKTLNLYNNEVIICL